LQFLVQWSGTDYGGSGVAAYDVYVSINGGTYTAWQFDTTNTSAVFDGQLFSTYAFYSVAVDNVGNIQAAPTAAQATTTLTDVISLTPSVLNALAVVDDRAVVLSGETSSFLATGQDQYGLPLSYQWSFGDGTTTGVLSTNSVTHAYSSSAFGTYEVSVTASNGYSAVTKDLAVIVADNLTITKLQVDVNFAHTSDDTMSLAGALDLPGVTNVVQLNAKSVAIDVGGVQVPFTLNNKGIGTNVYGTCKLAYTKAEKSLPGFWTLTVLLSHGNWHEAWATNGLINATITKPMEIVTLPVVALIGVEAFAADQHLAYTATLNKTGAATLDATKPTLTITAPVAGQHWSNAVFTLAGKASDSIAVASVYYNLNNTGWNPANSANKWTNWTSPVTLKAGTNTVSAYAAATSGNLSLTNTVKFVYVVSAPLTVRTNGDGTVRPDYNGDPLQIGASYSMTAKAKPGSSFVDWTDGLGNLITNGATLKFVMASNLTFVANFVEATTPKFTLSPPDNLQRMTDIVVNVEMTKTGLEFSLHLPPGLKGHIQVSTDLTNWETVADFAGTNTTITFRDPAANNFTSRFYRAVVP
jgi:hypothetical protein